MLLLEASNLTFSYGQLTALRDINLKLEAGEVVALIGPNGSGKSTLIRSLLGQLPPTGQVSWEGKTLAHWPRRELARRIAYLPQLPAWEPSQRVDEAIRLGRTPYLPMFGIETSRDLDVVRNVCELLDLRELLSRRMDQLSGGQRQRVFLARCLAQEPAALLLDEPSTHLDLRHQVELGRLLQRLARERGLAVLMASHELNLAGQFSNRLVLLDQGRIAADGAVDEVLRPELLSAIYGVQLIRIGGIDGYPWAVVPVF